MKARKLELTIGFSIGILPFLGLPSHFFKILLPIIGLIILYTTYQKYYSDRDLAEIENKDKTTENEGIANSTFPAEDSRNNMVVKYEQKGTIQQMPAENVNKAKEIRKTKSLGLAIQMLGYRQKQNLETSRLANRFSVEKNKLFTNLKEEKVTILQEKDQENAVETSRDKNTKEELEMIIDEEILAIEDTGTHPSKTETSDKAKKKVAKTNPIKSKARNNEPAEEISNKKEDGLELFSFQTQTDLDTDFLSRIGDEIEE